METLDRLNFRHFGALAGSSSFSGFFSRIGEMEDGMAVLGSKCTSSFCEAVGKIMIN